MSLEATMLVLDNSSYSINGDYTPTRLGAQADAVNILFNAKLNANPENEVGLMVMAGKARPEVLATPTQDQGKLLSALHQLPQAGISDLPTSIQVAQLALKHRQNKNQRQRIVVFVGSPLTGVSSATLVKLGKKMKKNNVAIDIVSFGTEEDVLPSLPGTSAAEEEGAGESNETKLRALHEAVNASDNSHFLHVEPGPHLLSDRIQASGILRREGDEDGAGGGGGGGDFGGIDPNMDPELAMALRMSLEEEQARVAAASASSSSSAATATPNPLSSASNEIPLPAKPQPAPAVAPNPSAPSAGGIKTDDDDEDDETTALLSGVGGGGDAGDEVGNEDEDDDLARALALSRGDDVEMEGGEDDEDAEIARAIALSMKEEEDEAKK